MHYYEVAPTKIVRAGSQTFTYQSEDTYQPGHIVLVDIGKRQLTGVVMRQVDKPEYATRPIINLIEETPLPRALLDTVLWLSDYYATPLAVVFQTVLPRGLEKTRRARAQLSPRGVRNRTNIVFNEDQLSAIRNIESMSPGSSLLHGVTGSGKTTVYIEAARRVIEEKKSVIVLVPEIALTSQLVDEFSHHFSDVLVTHSKQTEAERHLLWKTILDRTSPQVIIGPRSALFMPLPHLGLIVVDEAHEPSYKQEQAPRYSALRAASILAAQHSAKVVLGTATPTVADYYLAEESDRPIITLPTPAQVTTKPDISLIDMTKRQNFKRHRFLSDALLDQLEQTFSTGKQALIFHNRRGSASTTLCENCGWQAGCPRCFVPLTLHGDTHQLRCHICGFIDRVPTSCPTCGHAEIVHRGIGTKMIEAELRKLFPDKNIVRFDGDSEASGTIERQYEHLYDGTIDMIIGTQVVAKGLDLPELRTVGVIQADAGLSLPDYSASERTFQLLAQVIGRVGRSHHPTQVIVQSYQPSHPAVVDGLSQDFGSFYQRTIKERRRADFPPFTFLLKLVCAYKTEAAAIRNARKLAEELHGKVHASVQILGPTPAFYERQHETYRWQLVLKSPRRQHLVDALKHVPAAHWQTELDPLNLL